MMRQGTKANRSGKTAENEVQTILESNGYPFFKYRDFAKGKVDCSKYDKYVLTNVPYEKQFGRNKKGEKRIGRTEFLIVNKEGEEERYIRTEVRSQNVNGSVEEKLPNAILNAINCFPEKESILLLDGDGISESTKEDIRKFAEEEIRLRNSEKSITIMNSMSELRKYVINGLK